ncbi:hypothetical protein HY086_05165 [Candidatus Gottesmanbacteria bacterium]|nr:hypothetical protein [Candidatus Gottesmanbacteria bacterium]
MTRTTSTTKRPYFLWDYDLSEEDVRRILAGDNETEKIWMLSRILTSARLDDVWRFTKASEVAEIFPKLKLRPEIRDAWQHALTIWGYDISPEIDPRPVFAPN